MAPVVLLDIDGVLTVSWRPLPGAAETMEWLRDHGVAVRLVTNTSSATRREIARRLDDAGLPVEPDHIMTAVSAAAHYLATTHPGVGCLVVNEGDLTEDLVGVEQVDADQAGVVLLGGAGPTVGYRQLNQAFELALDGIPLVALHRNTRFQTSHGLALDMGAFLVGLESAAGVEATVVGKPAPAFFRAAHDELGTAADRAVMVGDDIESDVLGAQAAGITGVLVRTGKFRATDLERAPGRPDQVIDDIGRLPELLGSLDRPDGADG
jgi:HAD superfamily hydrolase (TIGR01458 family)